MTKTSHPASKIQQDDLNKKIHFNLSLPNNMAGFLLPSHIEMQFV